MPLNTRVKRNGRARSDILWNGGDGNIMERNLIAEAMLNAFLTTAMKEGDPELTYAGEKTFGDLDEGIIVRLSDTGVYYIETKCPLWHEGKMVLKRDHTYFADTEFAVTFRAGDLLEMWRD